MNLFSRFSRHNRILIGLVVVGVAVAILLLRGEHIKSAYTSPLLLPRNYGETTGVNGKLRFFNGRAFVDYDVTNGSTTAMLESWRYPPVKDVQWDATGTKALITSIFHSRNDTLGRRLAAAGEPLQAQRHWLIDIPSQTLTTIPANIEDVQWNGSFVIGSALVGGEEHPEKTNLFVVNTQTGVPTPLASIPRLHSILSTASNDVYGLRSEGGEYIVSRISQSGSRDMVRSSNDTAVISPDGKFIALRDALEGSEEDIVIPPAVVRLIEADSGKEIEKFKGNSLDAIVRFISPSELVILDVTSTTRITHYNIESSDSSIYTPLHNQSPIGLPLDIRAFGDKILITTANSLQLLSFDPMTISLPKLNYSDHTLSGNGFLVVKKESGPLIQSLTVNVYKSPTQERYQSALELIRQQGLNPDLFDIITDTSYLSD